ncbi:MAG TPA: hypothetical protein VJJ21_02830 [Candidatus Nanoarchaeia archaeon]|nr:hypothetical protein [Candidatus Nanoarchaeia archaeon]
MTRYIKVEILNDILELTRMCARRDFYTNISNGSGRRYVKSCSQFEQYPLRNLETLQRRKE